MIQLIKFGIVMAVCTVFLNILPRTSDNRIAIIPASGSPRSPARLIINVFPITFSIYGSPNTYRKLSSPTNSQVDNL